eukprot:CAMPEP_0206249716 /NCGR_PEP_ID=MMETSP0047_2-20121206/21059_1 /ASSEMBLY_ACC=CAM_ASM_000192 /TAXON_ID=195065 /ORGANISM="Chroomonas mesostigmatica_cf, Strain CCMP1168" /LENGTH=194 /DNA_ID=CAMNT_0053675461 /DNA_START=57 /DNA_END=642 /DNA_ORIENTATION=+
MSTFAGQWAKKSPKACALAEAAERLARQKNAMAGCGPRPSSDSQNLQFDVLLLRLPSLPCSSLLLLFVVMLQLVSGLHGSNLVLDVLETVELHVAAKLREGEGHFGHVLFGRNNPGPPTQLLFFGGLCQSQGRILIPPLAHGLQHQLVEPFLVPVNVPHQHGVVQQRAHVRGADLQCPLPGILRLIVLPCAVQL